MSREDFPKCQYFVKSGRKCFIDLNICKLKRNCPYREIQNLKKSIAIRDKDCLKYVKILEDIYSICRQCLDDDFIREVALEIIDKIEQGLE